jgi:hypothetical protein
MRDYIFDSYELIAYEGKTLTRDQSIVNSDHFFTAKKLLKLTYLVAPYRAYFGF